MFNIQCLVFSYFIKEFTCIGEDFVSFYCTENVVVVLDNKGIFFYTCMNQNFTIMLLVTFL